MTFTPVDDESLPDKVREPKEVAARALTLFAAVGAALGAPREEIVPWLQEHGLWRDLSPAESKFLSSSESEPSAQINFGWHSERLLILLWALGEIRELPPDNQQCDTERFQAILPPFADCSVEDFLQKATLLPDDALIAKADELLNHHWQARDARLHGRPAPIAIDIEIVQERHHAINWVTGYDGLSWDEVTTDT